jgi:hypothetical protein
MELLQDPTLEQIVNTGNHIFFDSFIDNPV